LIAIAWNMGARQAAWGHLLDGLAPDLALLQETPPPMDGLRGGQLLHATGYKGKSLGSSIYLKDGTARELRLPAEHRVWLMAAEVDLPGSDPLVVVSVHAPTEPSVLPNLDRAFEALEPLLADRSFVVGGDLNLSRNYDKVYGTRHHTDFLDGLPARGFFDCMRKFHAEEQRTFWGRTRHAYQNDHLFVSHDLTGRVAACEIADRADASDHSPVRLTLEEAEPTPS